jgi:hypothetical protein
VLAILSLLGALTAGVFRIARRSYSLSASASEIEGLILRARNAAMTSGAPARVVVDPAARTVRAQAFERLGEWSFEDADGVSTRGLFNEPARLEGAEAAAGRVGRGLALGGQGYVDCGASPRYDVRLGLHVEAWVLLERGLDEPAAADNARVPRRKAPTAAVAEARAAAIVEKGGAYFLGACADGALEGAIGEFRARTLPGVLQPGRWMKVALRRDGDSLALLADGIERPWHPAGAAGPLDDTGSVPKSIPLDGAPLTIGSRSGSFPGRVDEVRLWGLIEAPEFVLGPRESILGWKKVIHFDRNGHLDPRHHERGVRILLYGQDGAGAASGGSKTHVAVDYSKTYKEWLRARLGLDGAETARPKAVKPSGSGRASPRAATPRPSEADAPSEEDEERRLEAKLDVRQREEIVIDRIGTVR